VRGSRARTTRKRGSLYACIAIVRSPVGAAPLQAMFAKEPIEVQWPYATILLLLVVLCHMLLLLLLCCSAFPFFHSAWAVAANLLPVTRLSDALVWK
jgi:hypothetical protein